MMAVKRSDQNVLCAQSETPDKNAIILHASASVDRSESKQKLTMTHQALLCFLFDLNRLSNTSETCMAEMEIE
jgi:hypothetical protein